MRADWCASDRAEAAAYVAKLMKRKWLPFMGGLLRADFGDVVRRELKALTREDVPDVEAPLE